MKISPSPIICFRFKPLVSLVFLDFFAMRVSVRAED